MTDTVVKKGRVHVILCECGPIIQEALDLDVLMARLSELADVRSVQRYGEPCSTAGREWLKSFLQREPEVPVVIGGCSVREHGATFASVCKAAGTNPYLLVMANIREQGTWVTPDKEAALQKAERILRAAIARAVVQEPLNARSIPARTDVLVLGAGIAGLTTAKLLSRADRKVILVDRSPAIGGRIPLLAELFPNFECASCMLEPLMDEVLHDERIELCTHSSIEEVVGFLGNFTVRVSKGAANVNPSGCYGCKSCVEACPVSVDNEWDFGLSSRKAIYLPYAGALPNVPTIDAKNCRRAHGENCSICASTCPFGNIDLMATSTVVEYAVGAIVIATGAEDEHIASWRGAKHVLPVMAMERLLNGSGPTSGEPKLPGGKTLTRVAFVHCVDASGRGPCPTCSKICCMAIAKNIHGLHAKLPGCEIFDVLWERSLGGKGYREFYDDVVHKTNTRQIWLAPGDTVDKVEDTANGAVVYYAKDDQGQALEVDLVIYAPPLVGAAALRNDAKLARLSLDESGFVLEDHPRLRPFGTRTEGIFVAGGAQGPNDATEASWRGAAATGAVLSALVPGRELVISAEKAQVNAEVCGGCHSCVLVCPYGAIRFNREARVAEINDVLCRGCGACAATCPASAIKARNFADHQLLAEVLAAIS